MKDLLKFVQSKLNTEYLKEHVLELYRIARRQIFPAYHQEAGMPMTF